MDLKLFHPAVAAWFDSSFPNPTDCQLKAWPKIKSGSNTLIAAPTGTGKTLAAFLAAIDNLVCEQLQQQQIAAEPSEETSILYVSPLKALSNDIQKNLQRPLEGIQEQLSHLELPRVDIRAMVRTGDTPQSERAAMRRRPPHILVTTPESLYILLTSDSGRDILRTINTIIVDEIHVMVNNKRGAHLSLSLERLTHLVTAAGKPAPVRIGLSATQKPIEDVAQFLIGNRKTVCSIVDSGYQRDRDLAIEVPENPLESLMSGETWTQVYQRLIQLIEQHNTTLIFVNTRRMAERVAHQLSEHLGDENVTSHHGSLSRKQRHNAEQRLKAGDLQALVATASLELGIDIGDVDLVCQLASTRSIATFLQRAGRANHSVTGLPKARLFPLNLDELVEAAALLDAIDKGELDELIIPDCPLDVLAQQIVAMVACEEWDENTLFDCLRLAWPYGSLQQKSYEQVLQTLSEGFSARRGRQGAWLYRDSINKRLRARRGAKLTAVTSGGAIPDTADYEVRLEPEGTFVGTLDEDFAIESLVGDIFQLGNTSWRVLRVESGIVRVQDAKGQPPNIPFWFGEAPARSHEFSCAVSRLRETIDQLLQTSEQSACEWLINKLGLGAYAAQQLVQYLHAGRNAIGAMPSMKTLVAERFFDESGGMQLVLHSPFGSRINRGWGLALRKRFCRQFNFELQAAATEDAIILSLGETHSFPLEDVWKFLSSKTIRNILIQAMLDAPMFNTRWRWVSTCALAIPRFRGGKKVPARLQRMNAEDLISVVFPEQLACLENIAGDREIPDHPLVNQAIDDCLTEAMDIDGLTHLLEEIEKGSKVLIVRDLTEPSPLAQAILTANPYAFLDGAPAEERRTQAVISRRWMDPAEASEIGKLDSEAIARVRQEAWPDAKTTDELHDALLTLGFLSKTEIETGPLRHSNNDQQHNLTTSDEWLTLLHILEKDGRVCFITKHKLWIATERSGLFEALFQTTLSKTPTAVTSPKKSTELSPESALLQILRYRLSGLGPSTASDLAEPLGQAVKRVEGALIALEAEGFVLQGRFSHSREEDQKAGPVEWCERRLLSRIHHYTIKRLRKEIEPVSISCFMGFLFDWQHITPESKLEGSASVSAMLEQLEGFPAQALAWEESILIDRIRHYQPERLDQACLSGQFLWKRANSGVKPGQNTANPQLKTTPITFLQRRNLNHWLNVTADDSDPQGSILDNSTGSLAREILVFLDQRGACFFDDIIAHINNLPTAIENAMAELIAQGLITSDSFSGLRKFLRTARQSKTLQRARRMRPVGLVDHQHTGRWSLLKNRPADAEDPAQIDSIAKGLLKRYGIVFRRLLDRENLPKNIRWHDLLWHYRRLEAQGVIRGGRFVSLVSGEQFALPEALTCLRQSRHSKSREALISISAADPLNLTGILIPGPRIPARANYRIVFRNGMPVASRTDKKIELLQEVNRNEDWAIRNALVKKSR